LFTENGTRWISFEESNFD